MYVMKGKKDKDVHLQVATMIDPATAWMVIHSMLGAKKDLGSNQIELSCLNWYSFPSG